MPIKYLTADEATELADVVGEDPYTPTPIDQWGKDHWTTLAYLETTVVDGNGDYQGVLDWHRLRGNIASPMGEVLDPYAYPTRLNDGTELDRHNDVDCLGDMIAYGLIDPLDFEFMLPWTFQPSEAGLDAYIDERQRFDLTPLGSEICGALRAHKQDGKSYRTFTAPGSAAFRSRLQSALAAATPDTTDKDD